MHSACTLAAEKYTQDGDDPLRLELYGMPVWQHSLSTQKSQGTVWLARWSEPLGRGLRDSSSDFQILSPTFGCHLPQAILWAVSVELGCTLNALLPVTIEVEVGHWRGCNECHSEKEDSG